MKNIVQTSVLSVAMLYGVHATPYYSTGPSFPTSGASWNTASDGSGANGFSGTYGHSANDITLQAGHTMYVNNPGAGLSWNANSYTMEAGSIFRSRDGAVSSFNNGDITASGNISFINGIAAGVGNSAGGVDGTASLQLGSNKLTLDQSTSSASGTFEFGLNVVGSGTIDFNFANANITWNLSNLSSDYTGTIQGDTFAGIVQLAAGDGAINAGLVVGRGAQDRFGDLDVSGSFSIGALQIDGVNVANGIYTYSDLVTFGSNNSADFSDNLIDNGGTVYVGQAIPEPATLGLVALFGGGVLFVRRRFMI